MERIVEKDNLRKALAQVRRNKGAPGVDGMTVDDLAAHLKEHWPTIKAQLLDGTYKPQPVKRVQIPKASGGIRPLGIPTVLDRFIQQAVLQVLQRRWDRTFSAHSYGFRPGRRAWDAIAEVRHFSSRSYEWILEAYIQACFDELSHSAILDRVRQRVADRRVLALIKAFLKAGILTEQGSLERTISGTPQGGILTAPTQSRTSSLSGRFPGRREGVGHDV